MRALLIALAASCVLPLFLKASSMNSIYTDILNGTPITSIEQAITLLPANDISTVIKLVEEACSDAKNMKLQLLSIPAEQRTYANTIQAYDSMVGVLSMAGSTAELATFVSSNIKDRQKPQELLQKEWVEIISDAAFYRAFAEYAENAGKTENLTEEQRYFLDEALKGFIKSGYDKNPEDFAEINALHKQIAQAGSEYEASINEDSSFISVAPEALDGVAPDFIAAQEKTTDGKVKLYCNYPTISAVMGHCHNQETRAALGKAFNLRAYPTSLPTLQKVLTLRQELAGRLTFKDYSHYALDDSMIQTPDAAHCFLATLKDATSSAQASDIAVLTQSKPESVVLVEGKIHGHDSSYLKTSHLKNHYNLDPRAIAEYFPAKKTIEGIFAIYQQFMNVSFTYHNQITGSWNQSVSGITVYDKDRTKILGYVFLDLFPRAQKYSHACCGGIVPRMAQTAQDGSKLETPYVGLVIANFPPPHADKPSLLLYSDVKTFFHEFGHAMHGVLSCTSHTQTSGTNVLRDFVELPSQILELWMEDPEMLSLVSSHYQTGEKLPPEIIASLLASQNVGRGLFEAFQNFYSSFSLALYQESTPVDFDALMKKHFEESITAVAFDENNKLYAAFGHLIGYGPAYYGYSLSRAYAHDVFNHIKKHGLLDPAIGAKFVECILKPGGSKHPAQLLEDFLGRPASVDAYIADLTEPRRAKE